MFGSRTYKDNQVTSSTPVGLIILTYDATLKHANLARLAIENKDIPAMCEHSHRATEGIIELATNLDYDNGGEIASNLGSLYAYCIRRLSDGMNLSDREAYSEVINLLTSLKTSWVAMSQKNDASKKLQAHG